MERAGFYLDEASVKRQRIYALKKTGNLLGISNVASDALEEYLDAHENATKKA
jgi:hypothetical protein